MCSIWEIFLLWISSTAASLYPLSVFKEYFNFFSFSQFVDFILTILIRVLCCYNSQSLHRWPFLSSAFLKVHSRWFWGLWPLLCSYWLHWKLLEVVKFSRVLGPGRTVFIQFLIHPVVMAEHCCPSCSFRILWNDGSYWRGFPSPWTPLKGV